MVPKQQNGTLTFRSESDMRAAKRLLKGARVRYPGVLQEWGPYKGGIWKLGFPGISQLTTRAYWENALDTAGVGVEENPEMNPKRKKVARDYSPGTILRFDGTALDSGASGFFDVEVVNWHQGSEHNGRLPYALVRSVRTGKEFLAHQHTLHEKAANPAPKTKLELLLDQVTPKREITFDVRDFSEAQKSVVEAAARRRGFDVSSDGQYILVRYRQPNPSRLPRPSLIGTIADAYFPFDAMEQTVRGAVEDVRRLGNPLDELDVRREADKRAREMARTTGVPLAVIRKMAKSSIDREYDIAVNYYDIPASAAMLKAWRTGWTKGYGI